MRKKVITDFLDIEGDTQVRENDVKSAT